MKRTAVLICFSLLSLLPFAHNAMVEFCEHGRHKNTNGWCIKETLSEDCTNVKREYLKSISYVDPFDDCVSIYEGTNCNGRTMDLRQNSPDRQYLLTADFDDVISSFKLCKPKPTVIEVMLVDDDSDDHSDDTGLAAKDYSTNEVSTNAQVNKDLNKPWQTWNSYPYQQSRLQDFLQRPRYEGIAFPETNEVPLSKFDRPTAADLYPGNSEYRISPVYTEQIIINRRTGPLRDWFYYKI